MNYIKKGLCNGVRHTAAFLQLLLSFGPSMQCELEVIVWFRVSKRASALCPWSLFCVFVYGKLVDVLLFFQRGHISSSCTVRLVAMSNTWSFCQEGA